MDLKNLGEWRVKFAFSPTDGSERLFVWKEVGEMIFNLQVREDGRMDIVATPINSEEIRELKPLLTLPLPVYEALKDALKDYKENILKEEMKDVAHQLEILKMANKLLEQQNRTLENIIELCLKGKCRENEETKE